MLVLSRKRNEQIYIDGDRIKVMVMEIRGDKVRLGIEAPQDVTVHRKEIWVAIREETPACGGNPERSPGTARTS